MTIFTPPATSVDELTDSPAPVTPEAPSTEAAPEIPAEETLAAQGNVELPAAEPDTESAEAAETAEGETAEAEIAPAEKKATPTKNPMKKTSRLEYKIEDEPYDFSQCSINLSLTLRPEDGHPDGRPVVIGVRSHTEPPVLRMTRLGALNLPPEITALLAQYQAELPRRATAKAEAKAKEEAEEKAAEEKRKQARAKTKPVAKAVAKKAAKPEKPAKVEKPKPEPVSLTLPLL